MGRFLALTALAFVACYLLAQTLPPTSPLVVRSPRTGSPPSAAPVRTLAPRPTAPAGPDTSVLVEASSATLDYARRPSAADTHADPRTARVPTSGVVGVDALGHRQVKYDNGVTADSRVDPLGGVSTRFSNGVTAESRTDLLGGTTTRFSNGLTASSRVDALGHVETSYSDGTHASTRTDALGNRVTTYSDGRTETLRPDPLAPAPAAASDRRPSRR